MTLITEEYRELNRKLHESREDYGANGKKWANTILDIVKSMNIDTVLDYGCGKGSLARAIPVLNITGYDPAIEGLDTPPDIHDLVVCTDVLEHIEPELLDNVLDNIQQLSRKMAFLNIATRPAVKTLEDGRNAHLIVEPYTWWLPKIWERFTVIQFNNLGGDEVVIVCEAKNGAN